MTTQVVPSRDSSPSIRVRIGIAVVVVAWITLGLATEGQASSSSAASPPAAPARSGEASRIGAQPLEPPSIAPPPIDKDSDTVLQVSSSGELIRLFEGMDYSYRAVRDGDAPVPRVLVEQFPADIHRISSYEDRVAVFYNTMLPILLRVNEDIARDRARLIALRDRLAEGAAPDPADRDWLAATAEAYRLRDGGADIDELLQRVDIIPPSMALAQSAIESGWGTSALARRGNALFGQTTSRGAGMRASTGHTYAAYDQLIDSAQAYARNLNTHPAYRQFRNLRAAQRQAGREPDGYALMAGLTRYSELGGRYVAHIRRFIRSNDLDAFDAARLAVSDDGAVVEASDGSGGPY